MCVKCVLNVVICALPLVAMPFRDAVGAMGALSAVDAREAMDVVNALDAMNALRVKDDMDAMDVLGLGKATASALSR